MEAGGTVALPRRGGAPRLSAGGSGRADTDLPDATGVPADGGGFAGGALGRNAWRQGDRLSVWIAAVLGALLVWFWIDLFLGAPTLASIYKRLGENMRLAQMEA